MTNSEFSNEFDILYNNIMSNQAPGLDEYEKSVFLTKAQKEILKAYFSPRENKVQEGFDGSQKRQYDFSTLIRTASLYNVNTYKERITELDKTDKRSLVFVFPKDYFLSINEIISDNKQIYSVIPLAYDEYQRVMLKPYALPTKRAAWRLFTDKKNCNYIQEIKTSSKDTEEQIAECDYSILSTWADQKRNLQVTIKAQQNSDVSSVFEVNDSYIQFQYQEGLSKFPVKITASCEYSSDNLSYKITLTISSSFSLDDEEVLKILKQGFNLLLTEKDSFGVKYIDKDYNISKAATHLDGLKQATAPSKFTDFSLIDKDSQLVGKSFTTKVIALPLAEIIGKFYGPITYQLRYVKKPRPIILRDLSDEDLTIDGCSTESECELAEELHHEILQRAVELAKAAYSGDLQSQIALGQTSATDKGVVQQSR